MIQIGARCQLRRRARYYVTSMRTGAKALLRNAGDRWSIANSWHWVLDLPATRRRPPLPGVQRRPDPGNAAQPGDQCPTARWDLVDHQGHRRLGERNQGFTHVAGLDRTRDRDALRWFSNRPWHERFCPQYRHSSKGPHKCHWGSRMLQRLVETSGSSRSKKKRLSPGQIQLPFAFDCRLNKIPEEWHQIAVRFRRANGIRECDRERSIW